MARRLPLSLVALALVGLPGLASAQGGQAAKPPPPSKEQLEEAAYQVRVVVSAMLSDKVEAPVKDALFQCLYNNSFAKISEAVGKVIADNPGKIDKRNADQTLAIIARICGFKPQAAATKPGAAPAKPAPSGAKPAAPTTGR